ncbi:MAG: methyltransferase domain-containing protein [Nitrososphaerales archaeon]|jgi:ubiquinone/menaquinone biosynthesis C-methylase UbiE
MNSRSNWELFMKMLSPVPGDRILDVGAGKGKVAERVLEEAGGVEVYTLEPDEKRVASMGRTIPQLKCYVGGSEKMPFEDYFFDKTYTTMAAHHFRNVDLALREFARVLKKGGRLVILDVEPSRGTGRLLSFFENSVMRRHLKFMGSEQMKGKLTATGRFEISDSSQGTSGYFLSCVANPQATH